MLNSSQRLSLSRTWSVAITDSPKWRVCKLLNYLNIMGRNDRVLSRSDFAMAKRAIWQSTTMRWELHHALPTPASAR